MSVLHTSQLVRPLGIALLLAALILAGAPPARALEGETFAITEVDFGARTIEITNHGDSAVDPNGLVVCNFPTYAPISDAPTLAAGEAFTLDLADLGMPADAADGELALYLASSFEDPAAIVAYVQWGSASHQRSSVAAAAQVGGVAVWTGGAVDPAGGSVLRATAAYPNSPSLWSSGSGATLPRTGPVGWGTALVGAALLLGGLLLMRAGRRSSEEIA